MFWREQRRGVVPEQPLMYMRAAPASLPLGQTHFVWEDFGALSESSRLRDQLSFTIRGTLS
jgi:hypothetical protein